MYHTAIQWYCGITTASYIIIGNTLNGDEITHSRWSFWKQSNFLGDFLTLPPQSFAVTSKTPSNFGVNEWSYSNEIHGVAIQGDSWKHCKIVYRTTCTLLVMCIKPSLDGQMFTFWWIAIVLAPSSLLNEKFILFSLLTSCACQTEWRPLPQMYSSQ